MRILVMLAILVPMPALAAKAVHPSVITAAEAKGPVFARPTVVAQGWYEGTPSC